MKMTLKEAKEELKAEKARNRSVKAAAKPYLKELSASEKSVAKAQKAVDKFTV